MLFAVISRTSTSISWSLPRGLIFLSEIARKRDCWTFGEAEPISSKKRVPPSAAKKAPLRLVLASVKAPFTCPKRLSERRFSSRAPQFIEIKDFWARLLCLWIASAVSCFPVPVSPTIRTSASTEAVLMISDFRVSIPVPTPTISLIAWDWRRFLSASTSSSSLAFSLSFSFSSISSLMRSCSIWFFKVTIILLIAFFRPLVSTSQSERLIFSNWSVSCIRFTAVARSKIGLVMIRLRIKITMDMIIMVPSVMINITSICLYPAQRVILLISLRTTPPITIGLRSDAMLKRIGA